MQPALSPSCGGLATSAKTNGCPPRVAQHRCDQCLCCSGGSWRPFPGPARAGAEARCCASSCSPKAPLAGRCGLPGASTLRAPLLACSATAKDERAALPVPVVSLDNLSDPLATIVEISYGDLLGELLDTVRACTAGQGRFDCAVLTCCLPLPCCRCRARVAVDAGSEESWSGHHARDAGGQLRLHREGSRQPVLCD